MLELEDEEQLEVEGCVVQEQEAVKVEVVEVRDRC